MASETARQLRRHTTDAERRLWTHLRRRQIGGHRFRRQVPIGPYVADFCCLEQRLVVEVDGSQHVDSPGDRRRDAWLAAHGFRVIRFWNNDVLTDTESVVVAIAAALDVLYPPPQPSPARGEGG